MIRGNTNYETLSSWTVLENNDNTFDQALTHFITQARYFQMVFKWGDVYNIKISCNTLLVIAVLKNGTALLPVTIT